MNILKSSITALLVLLVSACATTPTSDIQVETEMDPKVKMSGYKTYAWLAPNVMLNDPEGQWDQGQGRDIEPEVKFIVNKLLRDLGMSEVNNDPDVQVSYAAGLDMTILELKQDPETKKEMLTNIPKGALVVALIDSNTGYVMWIGKATGNVPQDLTLEQKRARIDYALKQMFKQLPKN